MSILYHIPTSSLIKELIHRIEHGTPQATISVTEGQWQKLIAAAQKKVQGEPLTDWPSIDSKG